MQVSKKNASVTTYRSVATLVLLLTAGGTGLFAEGSPSMPQIGGIDSPTMPTVTSPTIGDGFYTPGNKGNDIYKGPKSTDTTKKNNSSEDTPKDENSDSNEQNNTSENDSSASSTTISAKTAAAAASSATNLLSSLSASDISSLGDMGLLSQLFSVAGTEDTTANLSNVYTSTSNDTTNILLKQVLTELEKLKAQTAQLSATTPAATTSTVNYTSNNKKALRSQLIRFQVNGYDILKTCRVVYISKTEKDNTFLLTGDRRYQSDGTIRSETFYLLFKSKGVINGQQTYSVAAAVTQDHLNQYSFLYQLSQKDDLVATQIGNLVCLRTTDPSWKLDLLLDLEKQ